MDFRPHVRKHLPALGVRREPEIVDEIAEHLSELYHDGRAEGLTHDAAAARARAALPDYAAGFARELQAAAEPLAPVTRFFTMWTETGRDVRYGLRGLAQTPGFTAAVVLTLALGIGANSAIFSAVDAVLLRPAQLTDPNRLVHVYSATEDGRSRFSTTSFPNYLDIRDRAGLSGAAAFGSITLAFDVDGATYPVSGQVVTGNYFDVLGVPFLLGRGFRPDDDRPGSPEYVVVLSHQAWQRHYGGDPSIVRREALINGRSYAVIGVTPPQFTGPVLGQVPDAWVPMALQPEVRPPSAGLRRSLGTSDLLNVRDVSWLNIVGRLQEGTTQDTVAASLDVLATQLAAAYPDSNRTRRFHLVPLGEGPGVRTVARPLLRALSVAVLLVLLIACANVSALLIVRALTRQKDVAVQLALGASRVRLVRQWLTESLLLALLGAAGAVVIAWWATPLFYGFGLPESIDLSINARVLTFTLIAAVASGLLFGCISVLQTLRRDTMTMLRDESRGATAGRRAMRLRSTFVVVQVALSLVLLVGAALFLRTLQNAYGVDLGYETDRTLLTDVNLDVRGYSEEAGQLAYAQILDQIRDIPGVAAASAARVVVLSGSARTTSISTDGQPVERGGGNAIDVRTNVVSHGYLGTLGIAVVRGRDFDAVDHAGSPRVAVVSRSLAARIWPDADPIGQRLVGSGATLEVIGVVPDTVYAAPTESEPLPFFYSLLAQSYESAVTLHVRTVTDPMEMFAAVRRVVRELDPLLALSTPRLLRDVFEETLGEQRMMARLVSMFGGLALALAVIGLYGVLAHVVTERRAEIGLRVALGARPGSIMRLVLAQGLWLVIVGSIIGMGMALAAARLIENQLFGVAPSDPVTLVMACALFLAIATLACVIPARRALRVDPTAALRSHS
ncbi:MAG TPA: ABC transporter permease [Vicinamibacterales bacterium]|nr:ABC transporter permease [Vicinamibacterales bacterium]